MIIACTQAQWTYNNDGESGRLEYFKENNYDPNLNCFFRIEVPNSIGRNSATRRVKVHFELFDFGPGYDYKISLSSHDPTLIEGGYHYPQKGNLF